MAEPMETGRSYSPNCGYRQRLFPAAGLKAKMMNRDDLSMLLTQLPFGGDLDVEIPHLPVGLAEEAALRDFASAHGCSVGKANDPAATVVRFQRPVPAGGSPAGGIDPLVGEDAHQLDEQAERAPRSGVFKQE
jgi:hypothetical protein